MHGGFLVEAEFKCVLSIGCPTLMVFVSAFSVLCILSLLLKLSLILISEPNSVNDFVSFEGQVLFKAHLRDVVVLSLVGVVELEYELF